MKSPLVTWARFAWVLLVPLAGCAATTGPDQSVSTGVWGGDHANLTIDAASAAIEFDCAHGTLSAPIALDRDEFDVAGMFVAEHGGPIRVDEVIVQQPARYRGSVEGRRMTLRVRLVDGAQDLGTYTLTLGTPGRVFKCL